ncbi:MAG: ABC transporter ATP-binding protein [Clostridiaceae bacterium]
MAQTEHQMKADFSRQLKQQFFKDNQYWFGLALIATILFAAFNLFISWQMQQIIDIASGGPAQFTLGQITALVIASIIGLMGAMVLDYYARPRFSKKALEQYKAFAFAEITKKSIHSFMSENTATYISAFSNDISSIETNYLANIFNLIRDMILFIGAFALMIWYNPLLTLIALGLSVIPIIASLLTGSKLAAIETKVSDQNAGFLGMVKDILAGFSVVKSFQVEREIIRNFNEINTKTEELKSRRKRTEIMIQMIGASAGIIAQFGVFLFGAYLALLGQGVTAGVVIVFVQLMNFVLSPISSVPQILANRKAALALIDKLARAITTNVREEGITVDSTLDQGIRLENLSFAYDQAKPVLENIDYNFIKGRSYAIVGGSGSGKSTLLNLLMGSFSEYEGKIYLDEAELRSVNTDSLYDLLSIVQQNVFIFNQSLRDNITMFHDFDQAKIDQAVHLAGLDQLVREKTWDYPCGENGSGLSGGERQRVSIARCLLRKTPILLVDEATASLDAATAFSITNSILEISGLTRIIVTHQLEEALLKKYDEILVIKRGRIEETGSFHELMAKKDYFYSLYNVAQDGLAT